MDTSEQRPATAGSALQRCGARHLLLAFGWLNVMLGAIGIVVPGMPATVFLLIALWAFSRSSERLHRWLYDHPVLGPSIRAWHRHRVIAPRAKVLAVGTMAASLAWLCLGVEGSWLLPAAVAACLVPVAAFILTRPGHPAG